MRHPKRLDPDAPANDQGLTPILVDFFLLPSDAWADRYDDRARLAELLRPDGEHRRIWMQHKGSLIAEATRRRIARPLAFEIYEDMAARQHAPWREDE